MYSVIGCQMADSFIEMPLTENPAQLPTLIPIARFLQCDFWLFAGNNRQIGSTNLGLYVGAPAGLVV